MTYRGVNAVGESWFGTYKLELVEGHSWPSIATLCSTTFAWIEGWYNLRRLSQRACLLTPVEFVETWLDQQQLILA